MPKYTEEETNSINTKVAGVNTALDELEGNTGQTFSRLTPLAQSDTTNPTTTPPQNFSRYTPQPVEEPEPPKTAEQVQKEMTSAAQGEINALNDYYNSKKAEQQEINAGRSRETASINTLTGLAGSTEANVTTAKTDAQNQKANQLIENERNLAIQQVLGNVRTAAVEEARALREDYREDVAAADKKRLANREEAMNNATLLAASGVTFDGYAQTDPEGLQYLSDQVGGPDVLKGLFTLNRPQETILDKRIEGGKYIIAYQNPLDGSTRVETVDLGLPTGYTKTIDAGNRILAIPDNWSGDPSELVTINKGLTPGQAASAYGGGGGGGLTEPSGEVMADADAIMSGTLNLQDISVKDNYRATVARELTNRVKQAEESGDIYGTMQASAAFDKEVSDTFLQTMEKTTSVLGQLGVLQQNITGTDTGPILGAMRGKNPWDTNAQTIKAQLNAIVPNLARGVYGEVGVLTDNDVRTYAQTLPNLTSTEEVRNAVLYITVDMIRRNIESKIQNQAAGQRDMSRFAPVYADVIATSDSILASLPASSAPGGQSQAAQLAEMNGIDYQALQQAGYTDEEIINSIQNQ